MGLNAELKQLADQCGVILLEWKISSEGEPPFVKLIVDTETGVTMTNIVTLHKKLKKSAVFYEHFPAGFQAEVTSPGLDYPLTHGFQLRRNLNQRMLLIPNDQETYSTIEGVLVEFDGEILRIRTESEEVDFPFEALKEGKLILE